MRTIAGTGGVASLLHPYKRPVDDAHRERPQGERSLIRGVGKKGLSKTLSLSTTAPIVAV
ncbi:hypothetical protein [Haladaptatus halobius]|uniref:hypothetical protein n=1 Tax=Haladaptatus halobius TaxID=2884875 RepID=UPI001D0A92B1|nr:hypothetical protein [Haladaptatus halobius]